MIQTLFFSVLLFSISVFADSKLMNVEREMKQCNVLIIADDGNYLECIDKKKYNSDRVPCWLSGDGSMLITTQESILKSQLLPIHLDNWKHDLAVRISVGDYRLLGIGGVGIGYPALKNKEDLCRLGGKYFDGTSDAIESKGHSALMQKFRRYAEAYNSAMLRKYHNNEIPLNK